MGPHTFFLVCLITLFSSFATITSSSHLHQRHGHSVNAHRYHSGSLFPRALPTGTCNKDTPCENKACCGTNGLCGYSPTECGKGNCTSNCDAKAECGQYGVPGHRNCPLNVCCSKFGFCGSTDDFCSDGCQSSFGGCGKPNRPTCGGGSSVSKRTIGYYESWANTRKCQQVAPEDLNLNGYTHINFAFAFFDPKTFQMAPMDGHSGELYNRFTGLKDQYRGLKTYISVGGWSFTDPGATRTAFSDMASNEGNRQQFIGGLASFMDTYGFDGVDIDWEYPGADDRGGKAQDTANFVALLKDMKAAFSGKYGITVTLPTSYWYLQHFDLKSMQDSVDWFNLMSYDLHGVWDKESKELGPHIAPHTNITEIDLGLDLLWRAGVKPENVVLGQGWYGRSFTLTDSSCNVPNGVCQFSGGAKAGPCSDASGILDLQEIGDIITKNNLKPTWDKTAGVKWMTWDSDQWVSFDDTETFQQKRDFANSRCLGGLMVWAMDQIDQSGDNGLAPAPGITTEDQDDAKSDSDDLNAKGVCYTTDCDQKCMKGTNPVTQMNGQPGQLSTNDKCAKGKYRNLCCPDGTTMGTCQWRGWRGQGLSCISGCDDGETELTTDTNSHESKKTDKDCTGGLQAYCCKGFKPGATKADDLLDKAKDAAEDAAISAAEGVALDIAAKAFCRLMVPALLAPLEAAEAFIPIIGEILDIAEIAATPALILGCEKGIEKAGKAEFKIFGKKHTLSMDKPKTPEPRPPKSTHTSAKTSTQTACSATATGNAKRAPTRQRCERGAPPVHATTALVDVHQAQAHWETFKCNYNGMKEACLHYSSVAGHHPDLMTVTCPFYNLRGIRNGDGPGKKEWDNTHNGAGWKDRSDDPTCQADEWPPALVIGQNDLRRHSSVCTGAACGDGENTQQFIRLINYLDNNHAGQVIQCDDWAPHERRHDRGGNEDAPIQSVDRPALPGGRATTWYKYRATYTRQVYTMSFNGMEAWVDDHAQGLLDNKCIPKVGHQPDDRGFLLLNDDPWFGNNVWAKAFTAGYAGPAPPRVGKRDLSGVGSDELGLIDGNSTHGVAHEQQYEHPTQELTDDELWEHHSIIRCKDKSCVQEMSNLGIESVPLLGPPAATPVAAVAGTVTAVAQSQTTAANLIGSVPESGVSPSLPDMPRRTAAPMADGSYRKIRRFR